ncbi:hypothetical protein ACVXG7_19395 [Enterobacter hormaechei]
MSTSYDFSGDLSGLSLGAAYSSSDRTNEQVGAGRITPTLLAVKQPKHGPLARNTMPITSIWR